MASNVSFDIVFDSFRLKATTIIKKLPYIQTCNSVVVFPTFILFPGKPLKVKLLEDWDNNIFILDITPSYSTFSTDTDWSSRFLSINFFLSVDRFSLFTQLMLLISSHTYFKFLYAPLYIYIETDGFFTNLRESKTTRIYILIYII